MFTTTNFGDTILNPWAVPYGFTPYPDSLFFHYTFIYQGSTYISCVDTLVVPTSYTYQLVLFANTNSLPNVTVHDSSSINMAFNNIDWGDGYVQTFVDAETQTHTYLIDGTYLINADAIPTAMYPISMFDSLVTCYTYDSVYVDISGASSSTSYNLVPIVTYSFLGQLNYGLWFNGQEISSPNLIVSWSFDNGMSSYLDFESFSGVTLGPTTYTVTYSIYDFSGNLQCTNSITNTVNNIVAPCNALVYIYEDTLVLGLFWAVDQSSGGLTPYSYLWSFGDGTTSNLQYPTHTYGVSGPYTVCLTITDKPNTCMYKYVL